MSLPPVTASSVPARPTVNREGKVLRQVVFLTVGAIALYVGMRQIPTGTNLSHLDFNVKGGNSIEFCDPANPQFIPVVAVRSPVSLTLANVGRSVQPGAPVNLVASLATSAGKPIAEPDLLVSHTEKLHLLLFDPELRDYQHVHPVPGKTSGDWAFTFTPQRSGRYRVFADFTPAATGRGLYASADLDVPANSGSTTPVLSGENTTEASVGKTTEVVQDGIVFRLQPAAFPLKARSMSDFEFSAQRQDGSPVELQPVMDAYAHLVAIDQDRSGFAHLHPAQLVPTDGAAKAYSKLEFKVLIPKAGRYVIWSQVRIGDREYYAPFWFDVVDG